MLKKNYILYVQNLHISKIIANYKFLCGMSADFAHVDFFFFFCHLAKYPKLKMGVNL